MWGNSFKVTGRVMTIALKLAVARDLVRVELLTEFGYLFLPKIK